MSIFNDDRSTLNPSAAAFDAELLQSGLDSALQNAFESGLNLDEIMYVIFSHTERTVKRYIVQDQLKKAAKREK
ncbi:MAG: hypothetical protein J6C19_15650 [Lachnospiraceae bacterium]|nr:hypothetical protein [Lachnospiraceae bacterium]MBO5146935.1 hypothetical protein [Lachnospiraceae bacterium]